MLFYMEYLHVIQSCLLFFCKVDDFPNINEVKTKIKTQIENSPFIETFNTKRVDIRFSFEIFISRDDFRRIEEEWVRQEREREALRRRKIQEKQSQTSKSFKSDECVICLTIPPNVLFCNCGHLCLCEECDKVKSLENCPVCKTKKKHD